MGFLKKVESSLKYLKLRGHLLEKGLCDQSVVHLQAVVHLRAVTNLHISYQSLWL